MLKSNATCSAGQASECGNAGISGLPIKDKGIWSDLRKIPEDCGGSDDNATNQNLPINALQCRHMLSAIQELFQQEFQSPSNERFAIAGDVFSFIKTRASKLVAECRNEKWLLKAVEIGACPEHFVELHLDLHWLRNVLRWARQEIVCDELLDILRGLWNRHQHRMVLNVGDKDNRSFITEVHECREIDKENLMRAVDVIIAKPLTANEQSHIDRQLAIILGARYGCVDLSVPPPDLERHVRSYKFNILTGYFHFNRLGEGVSSFAVPFCWVYGKEYVLKIPHLPSGGVDTTTNKEVDIIKREAEMMENCRHPYVVGIVGCWKINSKSLIMMEFMECSLKKLMKEEKKKMKRNSTCRGREGFSESETIDLMLPVAKALRYMHGKAKPIAHRDIKPDNIMRPREPGGATKLIDFGESVEFDPSNFFEWRDELGTTHTYGRAGSTGYMAPEVVRHCKSLGYCDSLKAHVFPFCDLLKADVFSFGMVLGELLTWKTPEEALRDETEVTLLPKEIIDRLNVGMRPPLPEDVQFYVTFIVESCCRPIPSTRPGFGDICLMLQNAQHLLSVDVGIEIEDALKMVLCTKSDGLNWPIAGKSTLRETMNLERAGNDGLLRESMKSTLTKLMKEEKKKMKMKPTCRGREGFSASEAIGLLLPIAEALQDMHGKAKPIAHRDIKPDNILCARESEGATKLISFGESVEFDPSFPADTYPSTGTLGYMAPELKHIREIEYCDLLKADVFSFGMVLGELLTWKTPEEALRDEAERDLGRSQFIKLLERGWRPHLPDDVPVYVAFIVESCWRKSPSTRPGFEDICLMLQNAQHLLSLNVNNADEETLSKVSYTDSDGIEWPITGKSTLREMMDLEGACSDDLLREFLATRIT